MSQQVPWPPETFRKGHLYKTPTRGTPYKRVWGTTKLGVWNDPSDQDPWWRLAGGTYLQTLTDLYTPNEPGPIWIKVYVKHHDLYGWVRFQDLLYCSLEQEVQTPPKKAKARTSPRAKLHELPPIKSMVFDSIAGTIAQVQETSTRYLPSAAYIGRIKIQASGKKACWRWLHELRQPSTGDQLPKSPDHLGH